MDTKQPEAIRIAEWLEGVRGNTWPSYIPQEAAAELRRQHAEIETLRAGYSAARLEIESLKERVQMLGQLARDVNSRRVVELEAEAARLTTCLRKANAEFEHFEREWYLRGDEIEALQAQLAAVGAGGVEPLRKRCLHQISEPAQAQPVDLEPVAAQSRFLTEKGWGTCTLEHHLYVKANPAEWPGYETRALYAAPQPAAPAQAAPASIITASVMRDDGGEHPAFCLMVAYRTEKAAMAALAMLTGAPAQAATAKQSPHPEYDKGFSDGWNRCEERQAAAPSASIEQTEPLYTAAQVQATLDVRNSDNKAAPSGAGEYPDLPDLYSTGATFWRAVLAWHDAHYGPEAIDAADKLDMLVADMLRAYVDADRAARGAAQAAPVNP